MRTRKHTPARSSVSLRADTRAVSPVIGAVFLLAIAVLSIGVFQTTAIPALNSQVEFEHSQEVQSDVVGLAATADRVADGGRAQRTTVSLGLRYPTRLFFVNPPPVSGTLRTTEAGTVALENVRAAGETGDYWNGTTRTVQTRAVVYAPDYNEYGAAPTTVFEPWVVYDIAGDRSLARTATDLVDGRRISLVALDGRFSRSAPGRVSVSVSPASAPVETVTVANGTDPVTLTVPTRLRNDTWAELLADELDRAGAEDDRYVTAFSCEREPPSPCGNLTLTLERGTYELALGEVAVGDHASEPSAAYLTDSDGNASSVLETGRQRLAVAARDRFDNPVSGVSVTAAVTEGPGTVRPVSPVTDGDGRAAFVYDAPDDVEETQSVTVTAQFGAGDARRTATFDLRLVDRGAGTTEPGGDEPDPGAGGGNESTSAAAVSTVGGTVDSSNVGGQGRGREVSFALRADRSVTVTGISVATRNDLAGRQYVDRDTTVGGSVPSTTVSGQFSVAIRDISGSGDLGVSEFVDPTSDGADLVVTVEFADGSSRTIGIG
ncbi:hypothetical protein ACFQMA_12095 [Halosimplex aquaticum]|uniref:Big-1 domain-containing protein n=1 Tax=Halosimplex aquaticum TaxID=3026162 RepID=A0ABD5Y3U9_9EURY|nr:hypothetical protein [Halosimplex aquaticum]